jgi:hypothetical protein
MAKVVARRILSATFAISSGLACVVARAQDIPGYPADIWTMDAREVALLPRYCLYTQTFRERVPGANDAAAIESWYSHMGPVFHHMHHYCIGLMKTNRALLLSREAHTRRYYLADAVTEYDYVIDRSPPDFVLLPEIRTNKGRNLVLLEKGPLAVMEFGRAIESKNDYWPPYAYLSDYYKQLGDAKKARELLEQGLSHVPDAKGLQRRLAELGPNTERRGTKR